MSGREESFVQTKQRQTFQSNDATFHVLVMTISESYTDKCNHIWYNVLNIEK